MDGEYAEKLEGWLREINRRLDMLESHFSTGGKIVEMGYDVSELRDEINNLRVSSARSGR